MATVRRVAALHPRQGGAAHAAVTVPSIAGPADREGRPTPGARQQVQEDAGECPPDHDAPREWTSRRADGMLSATTISRLSGACLSHRPGGRQPARASSCARDNTPVPTDAPSARMKTGSAKATGQEGALPDGRSHSADRRGRLAEISSSDVGFRSTSSASLTSWTKCEQTSLSAMALPVRL